METKTKETTVKFLLYRIPLHLDDVMMAHPDHPLLIDNLSNFVYAFLLDYHPGNKTQHKTYKNIKTYFA